MIKRKRKNLLESYKSCNTNKVLLKRRVITESCCSHKDLFNIVFFIIKKACSLNPKIESFEIAKINKTFLGQNSNEFNCLIYIKLKLCYENTITFQLPSDDTYLYNISNDDVTEDAIKIDINNINLSAKKISEWIDSNC